MEQSEKETLARVQRTQQEQASFTHRNDLHGNLGVVALEKFLYEVEAHRRAENDEYKGAYPELYNEEMLDVEQSEHAEEEAVFREQEQESLWAEIDRLSDS